MKASIFYRIAAALLLLFAVGHTLGFRQSDPGWGVATLLGLMKSIHFRVQGFNRTYCDLFEAAGFSVGVFYLFAAILAWQLGGLPAATLALMRLTAWAFAFCFGAVTIVSWRYLFILPITFSIVITFCLTAAAWLSAKQVSMSPSQ
ncbi:MAG: LIC_13387 family protein [Candidatus Acidiferrales bacterium]